MINFLAMKKTLVGTLSALNSKFFLTSDIWSASVGSNYFITIIAHYNNDD